VWRNLSEFGGGIFSPHEKKKKRKNQTLQQILSLLPFFFFIRDPQQYPAGLEHRAINFISGLNIIRERKEEKRKRKEKKRKI